MRELLERIRKEIMLPADIEEAIEEELAKPEHVSCNFEQREGRCDGFLWDQCTVCGSVDKNQCKKAKPEPEPVAWIKRADVENVFQKKVTAYFKGVNFDKEKYCPLYTHPAAQQKPLSECTNSDIWNCKYCNKTKYCAALNDGRNFMPAKQKPLSDDEVRIIINSTFRTDTGWIEDFMILVRSVEQAHGIK